MQDKQFYDHGEKLKFTCPDKHTAVGTDEYTCGSGTFSPNPSFSCHQSKMHLIVM